MGDRRQMPSDLELQRTYEKAIDDGKRLHEESIRFALREPPQGSIQALYDVETGYFRAAPEYNEKLLGYNVSAGGSLFVEVYSRKHYWEAAYIHHISGRTGLLVASDVYKNR